MLKRLRRASQQLSPVKRRPSAVASSANATVNDVKNYPKSSFLGLPPEIRNDIYEFVALDTSFTLPPKKYGKPPVPAGLLLACRQTQQEFHLLLLSLAAIVVQVSQYDFINLVRVLRKQSEENLDALRSNKHLWIVFRLAHVPTLNDMEKLGAWCSRTEPMNSNFSRGASVSRPENQLPSLPWNYGVTFAHHMRPPRPLQRYTNMHQMKLDLLEVHSRRINMLVRQSTQREKILEDMSESAKILDELSRDDELSPDDELSRES